MSQVYLAFVWHQHQPYYPDDLAGETLLPWVRMHGVKDYWGMAVHLDEFPEVHSTINLVPSLIEQLRAYTEQGAEDKHLRVSRTPAEDLTHEDALYLIDNGFMANMDQMIRPYPRYLELHALRGVGASTAEQALKRFRPRDLRDLQVWANLTWIHPIAFERDEHLAELRHKGRGYSEDEKRWVLAKQLELLREIVPLHKKLAARGQVELTTTPFYHPILPLLWDKSLARDAMPDVPLPRHRESYPEDAAWHIEQAVRYHESLFGERPRGMWPSEGSVCQAIIPKLAECGIRWFASDEEILSRSLDGRVARDSRGFVRNCELLYRPWRVANGPYTLDMVFRDHALSDLIGFEYQRQEARQAVDDFVGKLLGIGRATEHVEPALVSVILDGENCWEYYPNGGVDFLRTLYARLARSNHIQTTTVSQHLERHPPRDTLPKLFAGSWISHNFAIWIGHEEDRLAWDLLHETREQLKRVSARGHVPSDKIELAWRELHIAEGSDWFWWFGDDHHSAQDATFDYLFRKHLQNVHTLLGSSPPIELSQPIARGFRKKLHTDYRGFLPVHLDGRFSYFEWINAGEYRCGSERGTMTRVTQGLATALYFGFDVERLLIRLDVRGRARLALAEHGVRAVRIVFLRPAGFETVITELDRPQPVARVLHPEHAATDAGAEAAIDQILEIAITRARLGVSAEDPISFFVELDGEDKSIERVPHEGAIELVTPSQDFERIMWQV